VIAHRGPDREGEMSELGFAWMALRKAARDVMVFVGVDQAEAESAVAESPDPLRVAPPPAPAPMPFRRRSR
jgi:hypothetical protein